MKLPTIIAKILTEYFRYLAVGAVIVVLVIGYLSFIAPKISEVRSAQITTRQADVERLKQLQANIEDLKKSNHRFTELFPSATIRTIDDFLPSEADFPGLLLTVKNVIAQSGLSLDTFAVTQGGQTSVASGATAPAANNTKSGSGTNAPAADETKPIGGDKAQAATVSGVSVQTQDVSISISGGTTYEAFKNMLTKIESSRRLFDIVSLNFSAAVSTPTKSGTTTGSAAWTLVLRTYYLPAPKK